MLIGWAWGCAAMASGLHVRSAALFASQELQAQASYVLASSHGSHVDVYPLHVESYRARYQQLLSCRYSCFMECFSILGSWPTWMTLLSDSLTDWLYRSSAVHGVFLFIGSFALGLVRAFIPKLALLSIFGTIVLDVMCSYGPRKCH